LEYRPSLAATAVATTSGVCEGFAALDGPDAALLRLADAALDSRVVVLCPGALDLTCAMLRLGYTGVAMARLTDRPRTGQADIAIVPHVLSAEFLQRAVPYARRIVSTLGTVVIRLDGELQPALVQQARRLLAGEGFAMARVRSTAGVTLLRAEMPLSGHLKCA